METIHLYTENFFLGPRIKSKIKLLLQRHFRGPQAVEQSLIRGLVQLKQPFVINQRAVETNKVGVISGVAVLRQMLAWKRRGRTKKIIAGPNLVTGPNDFENIIQHPLINTFLVPSQWSFDFYAFRSPALREKMRIWPVGVDIPPLTNSQKQIDFLIYNKIGQTPLYSGILKILMDQKYSWKTVNYGQFQQAEYFNLLECSKRLIYLSESESQGLAMFEAWARGVPTFVWERGFWEFGKYSWKGRTASPYVTKENGMIFKDLSDFKEYLPEFYKSKFAPRGFIEKYFSEKICAQNYLDIFNEDED